MSDTSNDTREKQLEQIFNLLCSRLIADLSDPDRATPGVMQAALRFLSDNEVEGLPVSGSKMEELTGLVKNLPFKTKAS